MFVLPSSGHRVLAYPGSTHSAFDENLRDFCVDFLAPPSIPPARRTYQEDNPLHMSDLSVRFMGTGNERLRRTIELSRGLAPATGRVPTLNFPQGKFAQGKTPKVNKGRFITFTALQYVKSYSWIHLNLGTIDSAMGKRSWIIDLALVTSFLYDPALKLAGLLANFAVVTLLLSSLSVTT